MVPVKQDTSPYPSSRLLAVKVGGGLLAFPGMLDRVGEALARAAARRPLVVIPGGGPFADQVREFESRHGLSPSAAHWMAILGMDQYAEAIADHTPAGLVIRELAGVRRRTRRVRCRYWRRIVGCARQTSCHIVGMSPATAWPPIWPL